MLLREEITLFLECPHQLLHEERFEMQRWPNCSAQEKTGIWEEENLGCEEGQEGGRSEKLSVEVAPATQGEKSIRNAWELDGQMSFRKNHFEYPISEMETPLHLVTFNKSRCDYSPMWHQGM